MLEGVKQARFLQLQRLKSETSGADMLLGTHTLHRVVYYMVCHDGKDIHVHVGVVLVIAAF